MSEIDEGGPIHPNKGMTGIQGITRRDHCADQIAASMSADWISETPKKEIDEVCRAIATLSYKLADALITQSKQ